MDKDTLTYFTFLMHIQNIILVSAALRHFGLLTYFKPIVTNALWLNRLNLLQNIGSTDEHIIHTD